MYAYVCTCEINTYFVVTLHNKYFYCMCIHIYVCICMYMYVNIYICMYMNISKSIHFCCVRFQKQNNVF